MPNPKRSQKDLDVAMKAVRAMHGPAKAERLIYHCTGRSITKVSIYNWQIRGIPPTWADDIYNICGIPPWVSNPDVFHKRLAKTGYLPIKSIALAAQRFINNGFKASK